MTYPHPSRRVLVAALAVALVAPPGIALARSRATTVRQALAATGADADASGNLKLKIRRRKGTLQGRMVVRAKKLDAGATFDVTIDGVRVGSFSANRRGKGRARFRTTPKKRDQLLGIDPRGRALAIRSDGGAIVLMASVTDDSIDRGKTRCCLPDDSGTECEDRTAVYPPFQHPSPALSRPHAKRRPAQGGAA